FSSPHKIRKPRANMPRYFELVLSSPHPRHANVRTFSLDTFKVSLFPMDLLRNHGLQPEAWHSRPRY
ncbi:hypothetical protein NPIL_183221, partial [Nephila pilipes]